ncbi:hypothetical protein [Thiobacillus sp.]
MNKINLIVLMSATMLGSGCASIVSGQNQSVSLETRSKQGETVLSANCTLSNNKGTWFVTSPGSVTVRRSYEDLLIDCEKENQDPGLASVKSSTKAMAFGNILFGGVIGAGVDMASGAAYDYPTMITVLMGKKVTLGASPPDISKESPQATTGAVSGTAADAAPAADVHP